MGIAALYDIHGNLPALEAVLQDVQEAGADRIVAGGDIVPGPMSAEVLDLLLSIDIPVHFIQGNCEVALLAQMNGESPGNLPPQVMETMAWAAEKHNAEHKAIIATWPETIQLSIEGLGQVLFCHATPRNENEIFTKLTDEKKLLPVFENVTADIVVCGHTHIQFDRTVGSIRVINAGSVGMPFGNPGAYWLLIDKDVQLKHTVYNLARAAERVRTTDYPQAAEFALNNILQPPAEEIMLDIFSKAELK